MLDAFDEAIFSYALRQEFGRIRIFDEVRRYGSDSPEYRELETIADSRGITPKLYVPIVEPAVEGKRKRPRVTWQWFQYNRSRWVYGGSGPGEGRWAYDPPTLDMGALLTSWDYCDDAVALPVIRKVWSILRKITTSKTRAEYPHLGIVLNEEGLSSDWFGYHAMEWCTRAPARMLVGRARPRLDFRPPQSAWYQALRRKVIERYGDTLDDPGPPEIYDRFAPRTGSGTPDEPAGPET